MQKQISKPSPSTKVYGEAGLIYIRAPFKVETRENGQKKIKANPFPNHAAIKKTNNLQQQKARQKQYDWILQVIGSLKW